ncbi:hypothetical protein CC86DRAFT_37930 [Ophiobolus disseminans]|uniref:Uncharacterized protein n=1 Tax=Ophiobolus disseminans TaxID=1469910 RepID=A0A6A6ZZZ2_9PLEO|nr:hypothetical protein CC86DRAFT_37930 [Ophiobolus disseminans]
MPAPWRRGRQDRVDYVIVERDGVDGEIQSSGIEIEKPRPTIRRILRRSYTKRQMPAPTEIDYDSDDDDERTTSAVRPLTIPSATPSGPPPLLFTMSIPGNKPTSGAFAGKGPTATEAASLQPPQTKSDHERDGRISQTTEHLLIAAGSIGATIIIVMIVLALYTMRKRGLTLTDVIRSGKNTVRRRGGGPPPPPKFGMDNKQPYDEGYGYAGKDGYPQRAATASRSGSLTTQTPLQPLGRSDSFKQTVLERNDSLNNRSFLLNDPPSRQNSDRRANSLTPSSPILPIQETRRSASTRNTRSLTSSAEEALRFPSPPDSRPQSALPAPPTFRQFLSNRPSISQRPGPGAGMMSRFSWTNSNAPQTPHDASRDTAIGATPQASRDSFMTSRSSVPRFRTIDSWVNQQSNRVEEQRLKQTFRMTTSTTASSADDVDTVPEMPAVPKDLKISSGLAGKDIRHQRHDTIETAPIFKQHPGTEVRFSTRSMVPSEVLDLGRRNVAL